MNYKIGDDDTETTNPDDKKTDDQAGTEGTEQQSDDQGDTEA